MQIKTNQCMTNQKVKLQTILKEKVNLLHAWSGKPVTEYVECVFADKMTSIKMADEFSWNLVALL